MGHGSLMRRLEAFMQALPGIIEEKVDRFVSALREAAHDIYKFAKMIVLSTVRTILAIRLVLYILFGFAFLFSIGVELIESDLGLYLRSIGWLCIALGTIVIVVWTFRLIPVAWRATQEPDNSGPPQRIPIPFFIVSVLLPIAFILVVTIGTRVQFRSLPLRYAQTEVRRGIAFSKSTILRWSLKVTPPPPPSAPAHTNPVVLREEPTKPQPSPQVVSPAPPVVSDSFHARVTCEPESVRTRGWTTDPDRPENKIDMTVDSIDMDNDRSILHVAVAIHQGEEYALLRAATGAYVTDNSGSRYDLSQDDSKGYPHSGYRELKYGEVAKLELEFPKFDKLAKFIYFSHPQFPILKVNTTWFRLKSRKAASRGSSNKPAPH